MTGKSFVSFLAAAAFAAGLTISSVSEAAVPQTITHQGRLYDIAGAPVKDTVDMVFRVYDGTGKDEAVKAAMAMVRAGYENVVVVTGGLAAWQGAGYKLDSGTPAMKVAYAPKPRPGSLPAEEFRKIAASTPARASTSSAASAWAQRPARAWMSPNARRVPSPSIGGSSESSFAAAFITLPWCAAAWSKSAGKVATSASHRCIARALNSSCSSPSSKFHCAYTCCYSATVASCT